MGSRVRHRVLRSYSANSGTALVDSHASFVPDRRVAPGIGLQQAARPLWVARRFPSWCVLGK